MAESAESMTTYVMDSAKDAEEALSPERVKTLFRYDPKTGFVTALTGSANGRWKPGRRVGSELTCGYRVVFIGGRLFYEHRVIWVLVTGRWPNDHIDHINRVRNDNRWENLRAATRRDNQRNQPVRRDNRSGYRGVCQVSPTRWRARIKTADRLVYLGTFLSPAAASAAYEAAAIEHFGEFGPRTEQRTPRRRRITK